MQPAPTPTGPLAVRRAGALLHVTSLPSADGPGDLGPAAYGFVDFLAAAGCTTWQVLPLVPTHELDRSPYNATSAMAGNVELVSPELLTDAGFLTDEELEGARSGQTSAQELRTRAAQRFDERRESDPALAADFD